MASPIELVRVLVIMIRRIGTPMDVWKAELDAKEKELDARQAQLDVDLQHLRDVAPTIFPGRGNPNIRAFPYTPTGRGGGNRASRQ